MKVTNNINLDPWFVTGFSDAEGCFNVSVSKRTKSTVGYVVQARFIIELQLRDIDLLLKIQSFFGGVGTITKDSTKNVCRFSIVSIKDINNFIIPHFVEYPLQSAKSIDFSLWLQIINLLNDRKHLTLEGIKQIVSLKSILNFGLSENLNLEFPNLETSERPNYNPDNRILNPNWINGFVEGDGSFFITIKKLNNLVVAFFSITLNIREKLLLTKIQEFFTGKGNIYITSPNVVQWKVFKLTDLISICHHFDSYSLCGLKLKKYEIWKEILPLIENKSYLDPKSLIKINSLNAKLKELS